MVVTSAGQLRTWVRPAAILTPAQTTELGKSAPRLQPYQALVVIDAAAKMVAAAMATRAGNGEPPVVGNFIVCLLVTQVDGLEAGSVFHHLSGFAG
jgi:hypothetical protein